MKYILMSALLLISTSLYAAPPYISNNYFNVALDPKACAARAQLAMTQAGFGGVRTMPAPTTVGSSQMIVGVIGNYKGVVRCINFEPSKAWVLVLVAGPGANDVQALNNRMTNAWNSF